MNPLLHSRNAGWTAFAVLVILSARLNASTPDLAASATTQPSEEGYLNSAQSKLRLDDFDGAIADFDRAIELNPNDAVAIKNRGNAKSSKNDKNGAMADYLRAIELKPNFAVPYNNLGIKYYERREYEKAISSFTRSIELETDPASKANSYVGRANVKEEIKDYSGAIADCLEAIKLIPDYTPAHLSLTQNRIDLQDYDGAIADGARAIATRPNDPMSYVYRGIAIDAIKSARGGGNEQAVVDYSHAIELQPDCAAAYFYRGLARERLGVPEYDGAMEDYSKAIELRLDPPATLARAYLLRGQLRRNFDSPKAALADYIQAIHFDPNNALAYKGRGYVELCLNDLNHALNDYNKALGLDDADADALLDRGVVRSRLQDAEGARADFEKAAVIHGKSNDDYRDLAQSENGNDNYPAAIIDYDKALGLDRNDLGAYVGRATAKSSLGDHAGAMADFNQAVACAPTDGYPYLWRGNYRMGRGDFKGAILDLSKAIEFSPAKKTSLPYIYRAEAEISLLQLDEASADFQQANEISPLGFGLMSDQAKLLILQGRYAEATEMYDRYIEIQVRNNYDSSSARLLRFLVNRRLGRSDATLVSVAINSDDSWVRSLALFLNGSIEEPALLALAEKADPRKVMEHRCEAFYYAGMVRLLANDAAGAKGLFAKCISTGMLQSDEYDLAHGELARLDQADAAKQPPATP